MMANMSAVTLISYSEVHCANGWMYAFWNGILTPISIMMAYYGWISYRFRETRAMSAGQFFEMRYSRGFRRLAAVVRGSADLLSNCIGPAVAVRFLIYLLGLPFTFTLLGHEFHTFPFLLAACLSLALLMILAGGRISLLVTDSIQGLISYPIFVVLAVMCHANYAGTAHEVRRDLASRVVEELVEEGDAGAAAAVRAAVAGVPEQRHEIGVDPPLSQKNNLETPTLEAAHKALLDSMPETEANAAYQGFRTTYRQQTLPLVLRHVAPPWILSLLVLLVLLLVVSTDDTRIFDTTTTWMQDFILPFFRRPPSPRFHLAMFKGVAVTIGILFWCGSSFFAQLDYISMFVTIFTSLWVAGAGAVVTLGLYWRRGTTAGAYAAIISGGGISLAAILVQRNWASAVYPWLAAHGWEAGVRHLLETLSSPFVPWIDWRVTDTLWPVKFPVNSIEISFIAGMTAFLLYVAISLLTCKEPFDLDRMLHRKHSDEAADEKPAVARPSFGRRLLNHLVGITPEFTKGDRIIAWVGFFKHMVWDWCIAYALCAIVAWFCHWGVREWSIRCFVVILVVPIAVNAFTTVWFTWGTVRDLRHLFRDLAARKRNDLDNGMVEGHVSLDDKQG